MPKRKFFLEYFRSPLQLGTFTESSPFLVEAICREVKGKDIIELGAGTGPVTRGLLECLDSDSTLTSFEINKRLFRHLAEIKDERFVAIRDSAKNLDQYDLQPDCVVSGLPLTIMKKQDRERVLRYCSKVPLFIQYKYANSTSLLEDYFSRVSTKRVFRNIPPAVIYVCSNNTH